MNSRILLLLILTLGISKSVISQDIEKMILSKKSPTCEDISQPTSEIFANYIEKNNLDSAKLILKYWVGKCEVSEPILRARVLINLIESKPIDSMINENFMWYIYNFQNRQEYEQQRTSYYDLRPYFGFVQPQSSFDKVISNSFLRLLDSNELDDQSKLVSKFYSGQSDSIFHELQEEKYSNSIIASEYVNEVNRVKALTEAHFGWITGLWIPTGQLKALGSHPDIGFLAGWKKEKWNYDFILAFKFLKTKNEYFAFRKSSNTPEATDHFFGGQIGFEIGRDLLTVRNHEFQLISGLAMDGIDVLEEDEGQGLEARSIVSYNFNIGLGYRVYTNGKFYLGLRAKYNVIDYTINNAIDLTGNAFSFQFVIGNVSNAFKSNSLKHLGQKLRQ